MSILIAMALAIFKLKRVAIQGGGTGAVVSTVSNGFLLEDNSSFFLLEDNSSDLLLEA